MSSQYAALARRLIDLGNQCSFRTVYPPFLTNLSKSNVHLLDDVSKKRLLQAYIPFSPAQKNAAAARLSQLRTLSPSTAQHFALKSDDVTDLKLRLYNERTSDAEDEMSYICLSYRWPAEYRDRRNDPESDMWCELPTSDVMFEAILTERDSPGEGLWLDQICINQDDEMERNMTISTMDLIYKSARAVIIALDDIVVSCEEASVLEAHLHDPYGLARISALAEEPWEEVSEVPSSKEVIHRLVSKIIKSKYFERAWCQHELRVSRNHIFLIRCEDSKSVVAHRLFRFTGSFLYYIYLLYVKDSPQAIRLTSSGRYVHSIFLRLHEEGTIEREALEETVRPFESYVHSMAEVFGNKAGGDPLLPTQELRDYTANRDKMSIILNTVDSGLSLRRDFIDMGGRPTATLHQCYKHMMLLALAARDPVAFCTTGTPLMLNKSIYSWLSWPHSGDLDRRHFLPMPPTPQLSEITIDQSPACHYVDLDLLHLVSIDTSASTKDELFYIHLDQAKMFLKRCAHFKFRVSASLIVWRKFSKYKYASHDDLQAHTLAHALNCGLGWITNVAEQRVPSSGRALQEAFAYIIDKSLTQLRSKWWESPDGPRSAVTILEFLDHFLIGNMTVLPSHWWPFSFALPSGQSYLGFAPANTTTELVIPTVVRVDEYDFLARAWLLQRRIQDRHSSEWTLLGKTRLYGTGSFDKGEAQNLEVWKQQRVYGPDSGDDYIPQVFLGGER